MLNIEQVSEKVKRIKDSSHERDSRWADLLLIRQGNIEQVFPKMFSADFPKPMVANFIDVAARDISEVIAPLPTFSCMTTDTTNPKARERADKRTQIAAGYRDSCDLQTKMYSGADLYITFGMLPFIVEPDYEAKRPMIRIESPLGTYVEFDRFNNLLSYTKHYFKKVRDLCNEFPESAWAIRDKYDTSGETQIDMYRYQDKDQTFLYLPSRKNTVLVHTLNEIDEIPVAIAMRPGVDNEMQRGQFDDIMWVQVARGRIASLQLEAAQKSVQAPIALPSDVTQFEIGPDAVIRSSMPEKIRMVGLEIPPGVFQETQQLDEELMLGSRWNRGRQGQSSGSIVTGKGVEALMGGFDTQVKTAQAILAETFRKVMFKCFKMDEALWPDEKKEVRGINAGAPYEITYTPKKDINGDYYCDVTYGLMAGLAPNQALIFGLQALGAGIMSKNFLMAQMPFDINVTMEERQIEVEKLRDGLMGTLSGISGALPQMVLAGQDPTQILLAYAKVIKGRQEGLQLEDLVESAFAPSAQPQGPPGVEQSAGQAPMMGGPGALNAPPGASPQGVPPNANAQPPTMESLLAGMSGSGSPQLSGNVKRQVKV
jgi:hypothetical protein